MIEVNGHKLMRTIMMMIMIINTVFPLVSRFDFCVVSERIQASHCIVDRPLAVLTGLADPEKSGNVGQKTI